MNKQGISILVISFLLLLDISLYAQNKDSYEKDTVKVIRLIRQAGISFHYLLLGGIEGKMKTLNEKVK